MSGAPMDHVVVGEVPPAPPPPLAAVGADRRRTPAEEARTLVASHRVCSLATLAEDGVPWASVVTYGSMQCGSPVLYVSTLAEHGRNLEREPRGSIVVAEDAGGGDPLDSARVTLAGRFRRPEGDGGAAREAHLAAFPTAAAYAGFGDFSFWVLSVERVRWVGGYGRMDSVDAAGYLAAAPDPTAGAAVHAAAHLNEDHSDALVAMAIALGGYPDATDARCVRIDRYGIDLRVGTPRGTAPARVPFAAPVAAPDGLRAATVELARRAREAQASL
jgi:putative heme iron utilization protein